MSTFLVFVRSQDQPWTLQDTAKELSTAVRMADDSVRRRLRRGGDDVPTFDRAHVLEAGGVDSMPQFTFKYGAKA